MCSIWLDMLILARHGCMTVDEKSDPKYRRTNLCLMVGIWALPLRAGELQASLDARSCGLLRTLRIPNADDLSRTSGLCPGPRDFLQAWARIEVAGLQDWCVQSGQGVAVFGTARPLGKTFRRFSISHQWLKKTGQRVRWQSRRITLTSNVTPTLRREYPWLVASPQSQRPFSLAQAECHSRSFPSPPLDHRLGIVA